MQMPPMDGTKWKPLPPGTLQARVERFASQMKALAPSGSGDTDTAPKPREDMKIVEKQPANFQRTEAVDLMNNWLVSGVEIDGIAANNDEMAIGAIIALQQAGRDPKELVIGGIDATPDALHEMERGTLDVTVFQDGKGQGTAVIDTALKLIKGEKLEDRFVFVPWQLVTQENYKEFLGK